MSSTKDLCSVMEKYKGLWVAMTENLTSVVSFGKSLSIVYKKARDRGLNKPVVFKVPKRNIAYVGIGECLSIYTSIRK